MAAGLPLALVQPFAVPSYVYVSLSTAPSRQRGAVQPVAVPSQRYVAERKVRASIA
jgi:hypothetical protein